jgi:hypothetical protein
VLGKNRDAHAIRPSAHYLTAFWALFQASP